MRGSKIRTSSVKNRIGPAMQGSKNKIRLVDLLLKEILSNAIIPAKYMQSNTLDLMSGVYSNIFSGN